MIRLAEVPEHGIPSRYTNMGGHALYYSYSRTRASALSGDYVVAVSVFPPPFHIRFIPGICHLT